MEIQIQPHKKQTMSVDAFDHCLNSNSHIVNRSLLRWTTYLYCMAALINLVACQDHIIKACDDKLQPSPIKNSENEITEQPPSFRDFVGLYKKQYQQGSVEYQFRCNIYYEHLVKLQQQALTVTWNVGVNHLADLTDQQEQNYRNLKQPDEQALSSVSEASIPAGRVGAPQSVDWRQQNVITKVKNQGSCGSCWSFATCAYGQSKLIIKGLADISIDLSQQYLLKCTADSDCDGGYLESVFETSASGVPLQKAYSYNPKFSASPFICFASDKMVFGHFPQKMYKLKDSELINMLQKQPLAISISSDKWRDYKGGVFSCSEESKIDHAVLLIGYTSDYWIVKNQWGADWGEQGYIKITRNPQKNCKIGAGVFTMFSKNAMCVWAALWAFLMLISIAQ